MPAAWLVLPTYEEEENLPRIVPAALEQLARATPDHRLLIVNDRGGDRTGEIADELARDHDAVEVLHRDQKEGLGRAYLAGFTHALAGGADLVLEMDADFSHDPADLPRLIEAAGAADLVIGSRNVRGGGVVGWPLRRQALSRGGSWYARRILGVHVRDLTGGFKCFRRSVLEAIDFDEVEAGGYVFQIEMTYFAILAGFRVVEIPIVFRDREAGKSKMHRGIALEAVRAVPALRWRRKGPAILSEVTSPGDDKER